MPPNFLHTSTSEQQHALELKIAEQYQDLLEYEGEERDELLLLLRDRHSRYLANALGTLPPGFISLDASRPWICYWTLHGLALLGHPLPEHITASQVIGFLNCCQHPAGGYGGGPGQMPHLAATYAAVSAILTLGGEEAYSSINRAGMWHFLCRMAVPTEQGGGFRMHEGGESDARSCYTALAVASNLCLDVPALVAQSGVVDYLRKCQTYEGGIGGEPGNEAHGGYTFCGLAALMIAGWPHALDLPRLLHWATQRQGWVEGGFNGRTNKLVDGCYSFWQGGVFPLLQQLLQRHHLDEDSEVVVQQQPNLVCCNVATYPPTDPPPAWLQEQPLQQQEELVVPDLPDLSKVLGPMQKAQLEAEQLNEACDMLGDAALKQQSDTSATEAAAEEEGSRESIQHLLQRAEAAQQAADHGEEDAAIATASAAMLYPCIGAPTAAELYALLAADTGSTAAPAEVHEEGSNPLFNTRALQCWILRACQQLKGGLRDKPGKPADYYHSCYCLSGLSTAQHIAGGGAAGPTSNLLKQVDPIANIVVEKLHEAKLYFGALPCCW